jgi:hypothetical protein
VEEDAHRLWDNFLPASVKHDKELAWLILNSDRPQPVPFQDMLWRDPSCPLRGDRDILMASLEKGLLREPDVEPEPIRWSVGMATDRELVLRCFATHPERIAPYNPDDESGLPLATGYYWDDADAFRAFAFSERTWQYRSSMYVDPPDGVHTKFSSALFEDPEVMADLILNLCRRVRHDRYEHDWNALVVKDAFPAGVEQSQQPLLDNIDFALRLANGLLDTPEQNRPLCPVTFAAAQRHAGGSSCLRPPPGIQHCERPARTEQQRRIVEESALESRDGQLSYCGLPFALQ